VTKKPKYHAVSWSLAVWLHLAASLSAQPNDMRFEHISVEQGLSQNIINCMLQDHKGFMWFGTMDGLIKYDGYSFIVYKHEALNPNSLSDNLVWSILESHDGERATLWIGTSGGLNKFDRENEQFTHFVHDPKDPHSLSHNVVTAIYEDSATRNTLWIGTDGGGLNKFDREKEQFTHFVHDPKNPHSLSHNSVYAICEDSASPHSAGLWIGTNGGGLDKFDRENEQFTHFVHDPKNPHGLSHNEITSIYEDPALPNTLWIGTYGGGLNRFDCEKKQFTRFVHDLNNRHSLGHSEVKAIYKDHAGALWIGTNGGGLNKLVPNPASNRGEGSDRHQNQFVHFVHDSNNPHSLSDNRVLSIYEDRSGVLWIGTGDNGLNKLVLSPAYNGGEGADRNYKHFTHFSNDPKNPHSLSNNNVMSICEDSSPLRGTGRNTLWIGGSGGLNKFDRENGQFTHFVHDPKNPHSLGNDKVMSIYEDSALPNTLWIGTWGGGLNRFDRTRGQFTRFSNDPNNPQSLNHNYVLIIFEDRAGTLWIGTWGGGLNRFDRHTEQFTHFVHDPKDPHSLSHNVVISIYEESATRNKLWIGTWGGGLNRLDRDREQFTRFVHDPKNPHSLSHNRVTFIYEDSASWNTLWIGTYGGGLNKFDRDREQFTHYTEKDGLANNAICGILEDDNGYLWISTANGLSRFDPRAKTSTGAFRNYDAADGLQNHFFRIGACLKSRSGEMFFGGFNGLEAFYPDRVKDNPYVPPVVITAFKKFDKVVKLERAIDDLKALTLSYEDNFFSFEFAALNYNNPQKNQYAYKLEGFDRDWIYCGTRRYAAYTNLDPGKYVFRVKGSNNDGVWNEEGAAIAIMITPPFWQTWWFRVLAILSILVSAFTWHQRRMRRVEEKRKALELQVKEKSEAALALQNALSEVERLKNRLHAENVYLQDEIKLEHNFADIISRSQALKKILGKVEQVAATDATVLILGESGTGKELLARAVHNLSHRRDRPMVKVNCAALPASLVESELFGHEKGAFTGAISRKIGRFELADGGTIFLDEIGELPPELQAKLLRVLQEGEFERVGGQQTLKVDTRVIAATNRNLQEEIAHGRFREDLYYRLHVFPITLPPLRERREDVPLLINHFVRKFSAKTGKKIETVSPNVIETLQAYDWPGNVRELENVIERAVIVSQGKQLKLDDWLPHSGARLDEPTLVTLEDMERHHILKVLEQTGWRISGERGAAKMLNINASTLRSRMEKLGIKK
jgi:DNA-binding NtrC family response regulator/ligand-binding sensor domain-containing protein